MKIVFVLLMPTIKIVGGYKIVYEYANYLVSKGYQVELVYTTIEGKNSKHFPKWMVHFIRKVLGQFGPFWFKLDKKIKRSIYKSLDDIEISRADVVVATAALTAEFVNKLKNVKKAYFIQDYENWDITDDELIKTYQFPMSRIVISKWLEKIVSSHAKDGNIYYVPNGINRNVYYIERPILDRNNHTLAMLYHNSERKGCDVSMKVMNMLKIKYPDLQVYMFGSPKRRKEWGDWVHYIHNASPDKVRNQMNQARVFLSTSRQEGFGLTGLESLFCGCVLVSTKTEGVLEYANNQNSILCEIDNVDEIFQSVCNVFDDEKLQEEMVHSNGTIKQFDGIMAAKKFEEIVSNICNGDNENFI